MALGGSDPVEGLGYGLGIGLNGTGDGRSISYTRQSIRNLLERMGLTGWKPRRVEELSKGMSQKLQFVVTVLHQPELLVLDCMSYTRETKRIVRDVLKVPAILAVSSAVRTALELVS